MKKSIRKESVTPVVSALALLAAICLLPFASPATASLAGGGFKIKSVNMDDPTITAERGGIVKDSDGGEVTPEPTLPDGTFKFSIDTSAISCTNPGIYLNGLSSDVCS